MKGSFVTCAITEVILLLLFTNNVGAQTSTFIRRDDFAKVKTRSLIVMIEKENPDVISKLKKKHKEDKIPVYQQAIASYNQQMKEVVDQFWKVTRNVNYKTESEIAVLIKSRNKTFVVLRSITVTDGLDDARLDWTYTDFKDKNQNDDKEFYSKTGSMRLDFIEDISVQGDAANVFKHGDHTLVETGLPNTFPTKSDLIYGVQVINWYLTNIISKGKNPGFMALKSDGTPLRNKTLLLRSDEVDSKLSEDDIKKIYPYSFKIVSREEFDQDLAEKKTEYLFMEIIPEMDAIHPQGTASGTTSAMAQVYHNVYDAETGGIVVSVPPSVGGALLGIASGAKSIGRNDTNERALKMLTKLAE